MKLSRKKLKNLVLEEIERVLGEENQLLNVYQFLRDWDQDKSGIENWTVSKVGDKIEIHANGSRWGKKVETVIKPMGSLSGVYKVSGDKDFANELYNSIEKNLSSKETPQIVGP